MRKIDAPKEEWDVKKIVGVLLSVVIMIGVGIYLKQNFVDKHIAVKGLQVQAEPQKENSTTSSNKRRDQITYPNLQNELQKRVEGVKKEIGSLSITEIASSSPQIQKILKDIQSLQNYPGNKAREVCENICHSF